MSPVRRKPLGLVACSLKHLRIFLPSQILFADSYHHKKDASKPRFPRLRIDTVSPIIPYSFIFLFDSKLEF